MNDKDFNELSGNCALFIGDSVKNMKPLGEVTCIKMPAIENPIFEKGLKAWTNAMTIDVPMQEITPSYVESLHGNWDLIVKGKPIINKPKHLKSPHKKRKMRVLKKWKRRFGVTSNDICIPNVNVHMQTVEEYF